MADDDTMDFLSGPILKKITAFAVPLLLGNLFQQLYNAADTFIVGNFLGSEALAAVSSSGSLTFMMVGFFNGMAVGAGVVISHSYGAGDDERLSLALHSDVLFGIISGLLLTVFAVLFTPSILRWISTPEELLPISSEYFRIYSAGIFFSVMYNILMGILNAFGDSRHPLYYLMISSAVNIVLDLVFIAGFGMGVGSAAAATIISQAVSAVLCLQRLIRGEHGIRLRFRKLSFDRREMRAIVRFGLPAGLQNSIVGLANTVIQASVNTFSSAVIAGFGVYGKIEGFILLPVTAFSLSLTTFIAQTTGAGDLRRAEDGARKGLLLSIAVAEAAGALLFISAPQLVRLFSDDPDVIRAGAAQARIEAFFYFLPAISHGSAGLLRGVGKAFVPMLVLLASWCIFRVVFVSIALSFSHSVAIIYAAYPITWTISSIIFIFYLRHSDWLKGGKIG